MVGGTLEFVVIFYIVVSQPKSYYFDEEIYNSFTLLPLIACQPKSKEAVNNQQNENDSSKKTDSAIIKNDSVHAVQLKQDAFLDTSGSILGIWIYSKSKTGNASFVMEKKTIYYPETDTRHTYKIYGDSIKIKYDDYTQSLSFKIKGKDTLRLKGNGEDNVYYRVKK